MTQAFAAWQWFNACSCRVADGKGVLRLNLDETSLCLFQGEMKGHILDGRKRGRCEPTQKVSQGKRRCCLTHVGLVCDRSDIQPLLPQVLVGTEATFKASEMSRLVAASPPNVHLVRQRSAWNNAALMKRIIKLLAKALQPFLGSLQPILLLDAVRVHLVASVLGACVAAGIWPIVVPARMTWLLQPLDTHCFWSYKLALKKAYQDRRALVVDGRLSVMFFAVRVSRDAWCAAGPLVGGRI